MFRLMRSCKLKWLPRHLAWSLLVLQLPPRTAAASSVLPPLSPSPAFSPRCSLNGAWDGAACVCQPAWRGPTCSQLALLPMEPSRVTGAYRPAGGGTSWGANVARSEDGVWHMFAAEMKANCTLTSWIPNSQVVHAVSTNGPEGPFTFRKVLFDTFHHNPRLVRHPVDGKWLLFMIGGSHAGTAGAKNCSAIPPAEGELLDTRIVVSRANSLNGPWSTPTGPLLARGKVTEWDYVVTNPSPIILDNGTTLLYFRGTPKYWGQGRSDAGGYFAVNNDEGPLDLPESVGVARAPHWSGPYEKVFAEPILKVMNEDPFAWRDASGFHMLTHGRDDWWNTHHSYSSDGLTWSDGSDVACDPNITLTNGSLVKFTNRERPWIFFNTTTGAPALLFNGVCPGKKYTYAFTLVQRIRQ